MNFNRSTPSSGHLQSPPAANWRNHPPGADDGAGDGPAGENAIMPTSMPLPPQMMSTLQARLEQAAMAGDGPHSTLAERARYAAMFQNMEQQLEQLHQHRNQQQQQVPSPLRPPPTPLPMTPTMQFRRAARISQNQQNQILQQRQQPHLRASVGMEFFREREQRRQQREHNEPQQIPSASTLLHDAILRDLELHLREINRYKFAIQRQHHIEMQHLDRIVHDLSQLEQRLLQFARHSNISIPAQNLLAIFSNLDYRQTAHTIRPSIHSGAGIQQLGQPPLQSPRTVRCTPLLFPSMLPSQISPSPLPSQVQNSNFWEGRHQYLNRLRDIITVNINAHATQDTLSFIDLNNLQNSTSTHWHRASQLNGGSDTNNSIAQSVIRTFQTLQAVTENANRLTAFFHSVVINANGQNTGRNPPAASSIRTNQTSNTPGIHIPVPNLANSNSNLASINMNNERNGNNESISLESQQRAMNTNQQSIDQGISYLYNHNNTNNIYSNNYYYSLLRYIANQNCIEGIDSTLPSSSPLNNRSNNLTGPMPEEHGNSIMSSNASDDSASASFRRSALQEWQHFAKIAHENLSTANRVLETLYQQPEYAELYRQYHGRSSSRTTTLNNANISADTPMTTDGSTNNPTTSTIPGVPSNLSAASGVYSEDDSQTINEVKKITINPIATNDNTIPSILPRKLSETSIRYSLPSSSETSRVFVNDASVTPTSEVQIESNVEKYILFEQNNMEMNSFNDIYIYSQIVDDYNGIIEEHHDFMGSNITDFQYLEPNDVENSDSFMVNDFNYNHAHFEAASAGAVEENYLESHALENNNFMGRGVTDLHYLDPHDVESSNNLAVNDMETHSFDNDCIQAHFSEMNNGAIEGNHLSNHALENNDLMSSVADSHCLVANDVENRAFECNLMENNVLQHNDMMGRNSIGNPFYEYNNSENQDWTYSNLDNNYLESDEMVNSNHTCTSTYLENNRLQANGLINSNCADSNYNNIENNNNFMENNQNPFVKFNDLENHNLNWNNSDFFENSEDLV